MALIPFVVAADEPDLRKALDEAVRALQQERREYYSRLDSREREIQEERRKLAVLAREKQDRVERRQALEDDLAAAKSDVAVLRAQLEKSGALQKRLSATADRAAAAAAELVRQSPPADLEHRLERLAPESTLPLDRLETTRAALREEWHDATSASLAAEVVLLPDGRKKPARVARVGRCFLFFVTEDGSEGGTMARAGEAWSWKLSNAAELAALKKAVRILARQDAPGRAPLPLELSR